MRIRINIFLHDAEPDPFLTFYADADPSFQYDADADADPAPH
jgi:hypothetical protein